MKKLVTEGEDLVKSCGKDLSVELLFLAMLSLLNASVTAEIYWAYVSDPPVLHIVNWEENKFPVYVNYFQTLSAPTADNIVSQTNMVT